LLGTSKYNEFYETGGKYSTLTVIDDQEIHSKIAMAEDGYGEACVKGTLNGEAKTITTKDNPVSAIAPDGDEQATIVLDSLYN
jgi:hypothetical protein